MVAFAASPPPAAAIEALAAMFEARTGQHIAHDREWWIETVLAPVLRDRGLETIEQLAAQLSGIHDPAIDDQIVDALLNQESSFFRDAAVFDGIVAAVDRLNRASSDRRIRIWSAGCSTGQEPLSLAMLFAERGECGGATPPEIVATDVSEAAITRARAGRYTQFEIQRGLPVRRMMRWFDSAGADWVADPALARQISYRKVNLIDDPLPTGRFDIVLCRNVLLYLPAGLRRRVLDRLAGVMRPDGMLVLGAGETVTGQSECFRPSENFRGLYELAVDRPAAASPGD